MAGIGRRGARNQDMLQGSQLYSGRLLEITSLTVVVGEGNSNSSAPGSWIRLQGQATGSEV